MKERIAEYLGYVFCEFCFRWFDVMPGEDELKTMRDKAVFFVGSTAYNIGCYFYNLYPEETER